MNTRHFHVLSVATLMAGAAGGAFAAEAFGADETSPWALSILGGDSVGMSGSLRSPASATITDLGSVGPALGGASGTLSLDGLRYEDLFRRRYDTGLELDYSFDHDLQTFGRFGYASLGGRTRTIGELSSTSLAAPAALTARFANADDISLELGSRYYWSTGMDWRPFAGLALGATHLDAMRASLASPDASLDLGNVRFTRPGTVFSQSLEAGMEYDPSSALSLRFSVAADHFGAPPRADDPQLATLGFDAGNNAQSRWSFPVALAAAYHF